ncbi:BtrH N-terminal domain-containing protein [Bacillus pseudomycoides]|uniref:BtrH N-terminal domain-containing protein n=1 Tax=Bacillus pseudomycoides TaxID=64104 RepID=UPI000BF63068|nr:BtrH N-terminal domain-containing protein [Bacillus pseudomycoides]PGD73690.1 hypothetical protein COM46_21670 [Bacillus pseudomycoides]
MTQKNHHCLYETLQLYMQIEYNAYYEVSDIFNILGGHYFSFSSMDNPKVPTYRIKSNSINFERFEEITPFKITRVTEQTIDESIYTTIHQSANNKCQVVFVNCFYLPYDLQNYKKNIDNHMIIVKGYNAINEEFTIIDSKYGENVVSKKDFILARQNTLQNSPQYLSVENKKPSHSNLITKNILYYIKNNNQNFLSTGLNNIKIFRNNLIYIDQLEGIFRKIALNNLSKSFRHPHGPITTRSLLATSFKNSFSEINELYNHIAEHWLKFANTLVRLQHGNVDIKKLLDLYDYLIANEEKGAITINKIEGEIHC